jgi:hypothetical protein
MDTILVLQELRSTGGQDVDRRHKIQARQDMRRKNCKYSGDRANLTIRSIRLGIVMS